MISFIISWTLMFFVFVVFLTFKVATLATKGPQKGEPFMASMQRLWDDYRRRISLVLASPWLWAGAGAWTALIVAYALTHSLP